MIMTHTHTKTQVQTSVGSTDRVETNGRTDNGQTDAPAITRPSRLTRSVTVNSIQSINQSISQSINCVPVTAWTATLMCPMTSPRSLTSLARRVISTGCSKFDRYTQPLQQHPRRYYYNQY